MSTVRCELCPTECVLRNYETGGCKVRINVDGTLYSLVYGKPCAVHIDPIEKKPFFHFLPGSKAFSIATVGCVLGCKFCQNFEISQARPEESDNQDLAPQEAVKRALYYGCRSITYTYTEPAVFYEYMYDTAQIASTYGVNNTVHTCGYINEKPLRALARLLDAADVDLKAFTEDFYGRVCGGRLKPVLDALAILKQEGVWLEITNLLIPTLNDDMVKFKEMCIWIRDNLGPDVPLHISRFFPYYKLKDLPPTPVETLKTAYDVAMSSGLRYVYLGNIRGAEENTRCHNCHNIIVERMGYLVKQVNIDKSSGRCIFCNAIVPGVWG